MAVILYKKKKGKPIMTKVSAYRVAEMLNSGWHLSEKKAMSTRKKKESAKAEDATGTGESAKAEDATDAARQKN